MFSFFRIGRRENAEIFWNLVSFAREIRTNHLPTVSRIGRFEKHICGEVQGVRFQRRKDDRQRARIAILAAANGFGRNLRVLANILSRSSEPVAIENVRIERIHGDVAVLENAGKPPIAESNFAVIAAAHRRDGTAFLLRTVDPIRKTIVGGHVIKLRGWLVVPSAPGRAAIDADDRALIGGERDDLRIFAADPDALVVVAAGRALESNKSFSAVLRFPRRSVRDVDDVRIVRGNGNTHRAGTATADATIAIYQVPGFAGVVGTVDAGAIFFRFHRGVDPIRLALRNGNADAAEAVLGRGKPLGERAPGVPTIDGFEESAAGANERFAAANFPRSDARGPENGVDSLRIRRIEREIGGAGVFILVQDLGKSLAAVGGAKNAALLIRAVGVAFGGDEDAIWIFRIDENRGDLLGVAKVLHVRPGFSGVIGFIDSVAGGEVRALQSFAAANVNNARIGWRDGESADGAGGLFVEDGIPGVAEV